METTLIGNCPKHGGALGITYARNADVIRNINNIVIYLPAQPLISHAATCPL